MGGATSLWAQLELVPLEAGIGQEALIPAKAARVETLQLPFFDDFSTATSTHPDPQLWMSGSGVYINNTLTTQQPSINVATFDGLKADGVPYNFTNEQSQGDSDTLTSQPISLAGLKPADSLYISYYWQAKGLGELPDRTDTLQLEFLNSNGAWIAVWKQAGGTFDSLFQQTFIRIVDPAYLHSNFQFRFRASGRLSGAFDTWHIDYIYLNKNRSVNDRFIKDIAVRRPLNPLLKNYTAMPFKHYFANPAAATADSVRTDIVNLFNNFNFTSYTFTIFDEVSKKEVQRYQQPVSAIIGARQTQVKSVAVQPLTPPATGNRMRLRYKFDLLTTDDQNPTIPTVNLRRNDTISAITELADYYAYDDGSAEFGVRMNQRLGRTAVRFIANQPDTLGGVRMALVPFRKDISGQAFTIQVYSNRNGKPDQVLYQKSVAVKYGANRNDFIEYEFDNGVAVTDTFYVGWLQISEDGLAVGFDRNSSLGTSQLFSNLSTEWAGNTEIQGSIMIRPFFGGKTSGVVTGPEPLPVLSVSVFPNPTSGLIRWESEYVRQIDVYSLQGIRVITIVPAEGQREASLAELSDGLYMLRISDGLRAISQKILLKK
ncbi:T9SS type A sorting domain-containing protein [Cytophagaceae bacterium SJW1-29]|uniref:T9SS type A sorting domain-containing protein n=1 Tax=Salmonirosea aquatica TaxID=2654236 RepID=A0A7C9FR30_9BACT|nr:T9SS type A sorting domain-containing protein [Cytophagaceae bacterium SJW1-29]